MIANIKLLFLALVLLLLGSLLKSITLNFPGILDAWMGVSPPREVCGVLLYASTKVGIASINLFCCVYVI